MATALPGRQPVLLRERPRLGMPCLNSVPVVTVWGIFLQSATCTRTTPAWPFSSRPCRSRQRCTEEDLVPLPELKARWGCLHSLATCYLGRARGACLPCLPLVCLCDCSVCHGQRMSLLHWQRLPAVAARPLSRSAPAALTAAIRTFYMHACRIEAWVAEQRSKRMQS